MTREIDNQTAQKVKAIVHLERTAPLLRPAAPPKSPAQAAAEALAAFARRSGRRLKLFVLLIAVLGIAGCGGRRDPDRVEVFPVRGQINVNGKPAAGAFVVLHPKAATRTDAIRPRAYVRPDGSFELSSYDASDGAPPGEYAVTIELRELIRKGNDAWPGPNVLPRQYSRPETSPITVQVAQVPNVLPAIIVKK